MRITNINIRNYRQHQNLSLDFVKSETSDLHIVIARNGVGKTNLLNAITWCLYGKEPHLGGESIKNGLPKVNLSALSDAKEQGLDEVIIDISITAEDDDCTIIYKRILPFRVETQFEMSNEERFTVTTSRSSGDFTIVEGEEAKNSVEKHVPERIREYFFFDNEQLDRYFVSARKGSIRDAIFSISQVDIIDLIVKRISEIIDKKRKEAGKKAPDVDRISKEINTCDLNIDEIEGKIRDIEEQIGISKRIIRDNTDFLRGQEGLPDLEDKYQREREHHQSLIKQKNDCIAKIYVFIYNMKVNFAFYPAAKKILSIIVQKETEGAFPPNIDKAVLIKMLEEHTCSICNQGLGQKEEHFVRSLIERYKVSSETSNILSSIKNELERIVIEMQNYKKLKSTIMDEYKQIDEQIRRVEQQIQDSENKLSRFGDKEIIRQRHNERKKNEELRDINLKQLGIKQQQLEIEKKKKQSFTIELSDALRKEKDCDIIRQHIEFAEKGRCILNCIQSEMMDEIRLKMQERTTDCFKKLIWKQKTYDRVNLDNQYQLDLYHVDGYSCVESCSATERYLLALSFTLALHEVSGFNSLLFIDNAVGRASDINRKNLADVLCQVSMNKQIILTFSPSEYSHEISMVFERVAATKLNIDMEDEKATILK